MTEEELKEVDSQGHGYDSDNYLWIIVLLVILFFCCGGTGFLDNICGCEGNWLWILIIIGALFLCCGSSGFGNLFGRY